MKLSLSFVAPFLFGGAAAFAPSLMPTSKMATTTSLSVASMNGWTPDEKKFCYGLPGAVAPFKDGFDPFFITERNDFETIKTFRESEVTHGRVAMLAGKILKESCLFSFCIHMSLTRPHINFS